MVNHAHLHHVLILVAEALLLFHANNIGENLMPFFGCTRMEPGRRPALRYSACANACTAPAVRSGTRAPALIAVEPGVPPGIPRLAMWGLDELPHLVSEIPVQTHGLAQPLRPRHGRSALLRDRRAAALLLGGRRRQVNNAPLHPAERFENVAPGWFTVHANPGSQHGETFCVG